MELKICCACKKEKLTSEFSTNKSKKDGFATECKSCTREYGIQRRKKLKEKNETIKIEFRVCPECGEKKNRSQFHSAASNIDGLSTYCRSCRTKLRSKKPEQKTCVECGKLFKTKFTNKIFCSKNCNLRNWWNRLPEEERIKKANKFHDNDYKKYKHKRLSANKMNLPKYRAELYDCYIKSLIADELKIKRAHIPKEYIKTKKMQIKVKRLLKIKKDENTKTS